MNNWPYIEPTEKEFAEAVNRVKKIIVGLGAELVGFGPSKITTVTSDGTYIDESGRDIYRWKDTFIIIDDLYFDKPHIVFTYADTIEGPYEDGEPFPYDLPDKELMKEIKKALDI